VIVFDVGETLVDESRAWTEWAHWLGVSALTMLGVLGAVIERRGDHLEAFRIVRPGFDLESERRARAAAGLPDEIRACDLYPDALPCLQAMARRGYRVGVVGNANTETERLMRERCGADFVASSRAWARPSRRPSSSPRSHGSPRSIPARSPTSATASTTTCSRRSRPG
jgi:FMN phosphatase YigB (HAD superfamily)